MIYELLKVFQRVRFASVAGNHTRIDRKDDAIKDERLDNLIAWIIGLLFKNDKRVKIIDPIDTTIGKFNIYNKTYLAVHGDYDKFTKYAAENLIAAVSPENRPEAILFGHMHTSAFDEPQGVKLIRGGSLSGSGDDYTITKRLSGKPSQMVCICNEDGIDSFHPIYFSI